MTQAATWTKEGRGGNTSLWQRLIGAPTCGCCQNDNDVGAEGDDLPAQIADCDDEYFGVRVASHKMSQEKKADSHQRSDRRRWTDTSVASNSSLTGEKIGMSLNEFAVVHRAARSLQKAVAASHQPTAWALDRGVHVENVYDFYDPEVHKVRVRKMDDTVVHTRSTQCRHTNLSLAATLQRLNDADAQELLGEFGRNGEQEDDVRSEASHRSRGSDKGSIRSHHSERSLEGLGLTEKDMLRREAMSKLRRLKSVVDTEATANWGHLIGKVLHRKVLDFNAVKDKAIRKRRFEDTGDSVPLTESSTRTGVAIWLSRLQGRCKAIAAQALDLSKKLARSGKDVMDHEWDDPQLLTHLFSTEYFDTLMLLANAACKLLATQPPLVAASPPCRVFGDLHGQLRDLLLYFHAFGMPGRDETTFVFNGDFVDRGQHQLETVGLLLALKVLYPEKVYLIRGNHEDRLMNEKYGFKHECMLKLGTDFGKKMFDLMQSAFDRLPLACLIANRALVLHGGIGDGMWGLSDIWNVARPLPSEKILSKENSWLFNILWSDPIEDGARADPNTFGVHPSPRGGVTAQFAWNITKTFCARNGLGLIIRSHQSKKGSRGFDVMHSSMLMRVFSARDYEGHGNDGAVLLITKDSTRAAQGEQGDLLIVRPQVLRSVKKQRAEARRHAMESGELNDNDELEVGRTSSSGSRGSRGSRGSSGPDGRPGLGTLPASPRRGAGRGHGLSSRGRM
mmetsp:Transcript_133848/g.317278  ORF Transcript_133848/g.317278 Transcript_133848/m.317278 type:complete len:734 (-) Transcript_133848:89-2290(-)